MTKNKLHVYIIVTERSLSKELQQGGALEAGADAQYLMKKYCLLVCSLWLTLPAFL